MLWKKVFQKLLLTTTLIATQAFAGPVFDNSSYSADITFNDALIGTTMTTAYDGANYWSASGGSTSGVRYAQYDAVGTVVSTFSPGIDFRSVFTDGSNNVYARGYSNRTIYQQTAPGTFSSHLSLTGGTLDSQSAVTMNSSGQFVAMIGGNVTIWDAAGAFDSAFTLTGYSGTYPENRGIAVADNFLFTYFNQTLSAWDYSGNLLDQAMLVGAGTDFDSYFSLSYANNHIFVVDDAGATWRGYDIGLVAAVPEPGSLALLGLGLAGIGWKRRKDA